MQVMQASTTEALAEVVAEVVAKVGRAGVQTGCRTGMVNLSLPVHPDQW